MAQAMIEVHDLTKHFGPVEALRGVSFSVPRGQVVGLLGPNGAGKTTAMRVITGYLAPTGGSAKVDGLDVVEDPMACRRRIGYLPEGNPLYMDLRIGEALRFAARLHGMRGPEVDEAVANSLEVAGLVGEERRLVGNMSKGYRQRVGLAAALLHRPDILILDEPTSGLDPNQQEEMRTLIRQLGDERTVILSTHILPEVEAVCDRALIISNGKLVEDGTVEDIRRKAASGPTAVLVLRGAEDEARGAFAGLEFVSTVEVEPLVEDGYVRARVRLLGDDVERAHLEELAAAAHAQGLGLSELTRETASLEQIFAHLTVGADGDEVELEIVPEPLEGEEV